MTAGGPAASLRLSPRSAWVAARRPRRPHSPATRKPPKPERFGALPVLPRRAIARLALSVLAHPLLDERWEEHVVGDGGNFLRFLPRLLQQCELALQRS